MRRFGLEVEFEGDLDRVMEKLLASGLNVIDRRYTHSGSDMENWTLKRDGSVSRGGELVSPPLDFDDPAQREQVTTAVKALAEAGAQPAPAAGIHVHIEALNFDGSPMTGRQLAAVARFFYKFEDAIYRIASSGWQSIRPGARTYAKKIPESTARAIMDVKTVDELRNVWDGMALNGRRRASRAARTHHDRYFAVNFRSFFQRGTIEFRVFNSSVNARRVQTYIALSMAMVDDARHGFSRSVKKNYPLGSMRDGTVSDKALLLRLQQVLRTESKDTKVLMSTEDWKNLRNLCWKDSVPQQNIFASTGW